MANSESRLPLKPRSDPVNPSAQRVTETGEIIPEASLLPNLILRASALYVSSITDDSSILSEDDSKGTT